MAKNSTTLPFFKFDPMSWMKGKVQLLNNEEKGAFLELVVRIWLENGQIKNDDFLPRLIRVEKVTFLKMIQAFLEIGIMYENDGFLRVKFIDEQLNEREEFKRRQSEFGKSGGRPKKGTKPIQKAESREQKEEINSLPPVENGRATSDSFFPDAERIWKKHPKCRAMTDDIRAIADAIEREAEKPGAVEAEVICRLEKAVETYAAAVAQWPKTEVKYITPCRKWFEEGRYWDDPESWVRNPKDSKPKFDPRDPSTWD